MLSDDWVGLFGRQIDSLLQDPECEPVEEIIDKLCYYGGEHGALVQEQIDKWMGYRRGNKASAQDQQREQQREQQKEQQKEQRAKPTGKPRPPAEVKAPVLLEGGREYTGVARIGKKFGGVIAACGRLVQVGEFLTSHEAAHAHDRALIRAFGPQAAEGLNFPLTQYAQDPLEKFNAYDGALKKALFTTPWGGPKQCDFGFLATQLVHTGVVRRGVKRGEGAG
ncbi:hypothetical protein B484DRAFT_62126, partial [Ochromonadaceae sp. CCMP2298]